MMYDSTRDDPIGELKVFSCMAAMRGGPTYTARETCLLRNHPKPDRAFPLDSLTASRKV